MSPVTSAGHGTIRLRSSGAAGPATATSAVPAPMPAGTTVGHGTTRLLGRPAAYNASLVPSAPPPTQETAVSGAARARISLR